jgi:hypothetical protein
VQVSDYNLVLEIKRMITGIPGGEGMLSEQFCRTG